MSSTTELVVPAVIGDRHESGGLDSIRGFYYQWLYALRLMSDLLSGEYDGYRCESVDDYVAWAIDKSAQKIEKLLVVQVKSRASGRCLLRRVSEVRKVLASFQRIYDERLSQVDLSSAELEFRLVYNPIHDCREAGCVSKLQEMIEFSGLGGSTEEPRSPLTCKVVFEPFLRIPHDADELRGELQFLEDAAPKLLRFFARPSRPAAFIKSLIGMIAPFQGTRRGKFSASDIDVAIAASNRQSVLSDLRSALAHASERANDSSRRSLLKRRMIAATTLVERDLFLKRTRRRVSNNKGTLRIEYSTQDEVRNALLKVRTLERTGSIASFWHSSKLEFSSDAKASTLSQAIGDLVPLSKFIKAHPRHRDRVFLILSLVRSIGEWAKEGVFLSDFRATHRDFKHLYFVRTGDHPTLVLGDLDIFGLEDPDQEGLLTSEQIRGPALARAMREIYYGANTNARKRSSRLFRATWNDNVVDEYAKWLEQELPRASAIVDDVGALFEAEEFGYPIVVNGVDAQFIQDALDSDILPPAKIFEDFRPTGLLFDRAPRQPGVYYAISERSQIGLRLAGNAVLMAHRFAYYDNRRWGSAFDRDLRMSEPFDGRPMLVSAARVEDVKHIVEEIFGINYSTYLTTLNSRLGQARARAGQRVLPPILQQQDDWLTRQYERLDLLAGTSFGYQAWSPRTNSLQPRLMISDGKKLHDHLVRSGYSSKREWSQLTIRGTDGEGGDFRAVAEELQFGNEGAGLTIWMESDEGGLPTTGELLLVDRGAEAVVRADSAPLRVLKASFDSPVESSPAPNDAWMFLEKLIGTATLPKRSHEGLWNPDSVFGSGTQSSHSTLDSSADAANAVYARLFASNSSPKCCVVTGAAGTGKTRFVAGLATRYLDDVTYASADVPPRIVVVAATHYALDNFARVFRTQSSDRHVPYRFVPAAKRERQSVKGEWDPDIWEWSDQHYRKLVAALPRTLNKGTHPLAPSTLAEKIRVDLKMVEASLPFRSDGSALIPTHEAWRSRFAPASRVLARYEGAFLTNVLKQRLESLKEYVTDPPKTQASGAEGADLEPYASFASRMVITTVDAFMSIPDTRFDLVICEEASQLRLAKLLKVLAKVTRARGDGTLPAVLLSGDGRQLPPFVESVDHEEQFSTPGTVKAAENLRREIVSAESPFEAICRRNPSLVTTLSQQRRMHPSIAEFVRSLFYSDQAWNTANEDKSNRVYWIDTSSLPNVSPSRLGTSLFNKREVEITTKLVRTLLKDTNDILVVSPYSAQVAKLDDAIGSMAKVKTIDGCQGKEAHSVVVSFVSLNFAPGRDFVVEPRRVNVALSRAAERLYLVGNLAELTQSIRGVGHQYPHMTGLACLFGPNGALASNVKRAAP